MFWFLICIFRNNSRGITKIKTNTRKRTKQGRITTPGILTLYNLAVSLRTTKSIIQKFYMVLALLWVFCTVSEQTATFALYVINWLVFITVVESVYSAVQTDSLYMYKADYASSFKGSVSVIELSSQHV
jgi:hypothetical protein